MKRKTLLWVGGLLCAALVVAFAAQVVMRLQGVGLARMSPEALSDKLSPHYRAILPEEGTGPFPTALLASGCDGPKDNMDTWAEALNEIGWAALVVDSHTPRGFDREPLWRLVCTGAVLSGGERAGDLAVALADAREMEFVDPERLALIGASHGGWAVLDLLALADRPRRPENLRRWPTSPNRDPLAGVVALAAIYPYCGAASRVAHWGWKRELPVCFALVEDDSIVDSEDCAEIASWQKTIGSPITVERFSAVSHGFDQMEKSTFSQLSYDEDATSKLISSLQNFLGKS
ncbi:MAG: dienelactone hydrolase [Pseudomonadota bacterium]